MTPFHFGTRQRRLFGCYDAAHKVAGPSRAAVLCHPLGNEQVFAYRTLRQLASRMAQAGYHVLRFDYYGTGDSYGEADRIDYVGWCDDIETAIEEIKDMTGAAKVSLAGLRLGANLAARVAARGADRIDKLVLWEPLLERELESAVAAAARELEQPGCAFAALAAEQLSQLRLEPAGVELPRRTLVVLMGQGTAPKGLEGLHVERSGDVAAWIEERTVTGTVPAAALRAIVDWLA